MKSISTFLVVLVPLFFFDYAIAQTCGCAGAPLLNTQTISAASRHNLLIGLSYQHHAINDLYNGNERLDNPSVRRSTSTALLEFHYGFTQRLTISGTFSLIDKTRESGLQTPDPVTISTRGLGDALFMVKYVVHQNTIREQYQLAIGLGVKAPLGDFGLKANNIQLNADMQPGTGSWDAVVWSYYSKTFSPATNLNLFWVNSYKLNGDAQRFESADDRYRFGNEFVSTLGIGNKLFRDWNYVLSAQYRSTQAHRLEGNPLPNTGGHWVYIRPSLRTKITRGLSFQLTAQLPVFQHLEGIQSTSTFALTGSLFYSFKPRLIF